MYPPIDLKVAFFWKTGQLHLVVAVNEAEQYATVHGNVDGKRTLRKISLEQLSNHLAQSTNLSLDGLNSENTQRRVYEKGGSLVLQSSRR